LNLEAASHLFSDIQLLPCFVVMGCVV